MSPPSPDIDWVFPLRDHERHLSILKRGQDDRLWSYITHQDREYLVLLPDGTQVALTSEQVDAIPLVSYLRAPLSCIHADLPATRTD
jgi:hypothetical protein